MVRAGSPTTFFLVLHSQCNAWKKRPYEIFLKNRSKNVRISYICFLLRSCLSGKKDKLKCFICLIVFIDVYGLLLWFASERYSSIG